MGSPEPIGLWWAVITGPQHEAGRYRMQDLLGIHRPIPVSVFDDAAVQLTKISKIRPAVLDGYASSLVLLAKEAERRDDKSVRPKIVIGGADLIDASSRKYVEQVFKTQFYDEYACVELERLAWQCEKKEEYHIDADSIIMLFVDKNGDEVSAGESGEIVCTSLFNFAMPFIRYSVGDIGKGSESSECSCGRTFPLMKVVEGRNDSFVILPNGRILSPLALGWVMEFYKYYSCIEQYCIIQKRTDLLRFLIKRKIWSVDEKSMEIELTTYLRRMLNTGEGPITFEIEFVTEIPKDRGGKLRKVVSEIGALR